MDTDCFAKHHLAQVAAAILMLLEQEKTVVMTPLDWMHTMHVSTIEY